MKIEITYNDDKPNEEKEVKTFIELKEKILKNAEKIKHINIISEKFSKEELALAMLCKNFKYQIDDNLEIISSEDILKYKNKNKNIEIYGNNLLVGKSKINLPFLNKEERKEFKELIDFLKLLEKKEQNFKIEIFEKEDWIKATLKWKNDNSYPASIFTTDNVCLKGYIVDTFNEKIFEIKYKDEGEKMPNIFNDFTIFSLDGIGFIENEENFLQINNISLEFSLYDNEHKLLFAFYIENNKIFLYDQYQNLDIEKQIKYFNNISNMLKTFSFYINGKSDFKFLEKNLKLFLNEINNLTEKEKNILLENEKKYNNLLNKIENFNLLQ